ncbi:hypothetical protein [Cupriavidus sp. IDO]|uniref:hypothetical protein n=1 Tax=Cupriavidus sp. IDO TaxID=1539142 RepID=UPI0005790F4A|nr:hypothetical protein [Cupriavidus sp. IDO]KWR89713.1 hypothetical protein RM96_12330 [Cupriavidus sp. IDO]
MSADTLLSRLDSVRQTGRGRWVCNCPAHESKSKQSLAVRELDDGRVLLHCFAGCSPHEVMFAVGLDMSDLFPDAAATHLPRERKPFNAHDVLRCVAFELAVAVQFLNMVRRGEPLSDQHNERFLACVERLITAEEIANA